MKLGIVGTGMIAQLVGPHLEEWGCHVAAVCGTPATLDQAEELCGRIGGATYGDYGQMLEEADIDTVYVAVPNFLHFSFVRSALLAGKHVIVEKPFASNYAESSELAELACEQGLLLYEAISTIHLPNYAKLRELLPRIGEIRMVSCNYSQYSSRYDRFRAGEVLPAFDPAKSGGALMDLGLYNLQWIMGLFGDPERAAYVPNVERGIDASGVLILDYESFKAVSVAAKDCAAPARCIVQGTKGYLVQDTPANSCGPVTLHLNDGSEERYDLNPKLQWESEFRAFAKGIEVGDTQGCYELLDHSLAVSRVMTRARLAAGIRFVADGDGGVCTAGGDGGCTAGDCTAVGCAPDDGGTRVTAGSMTSLAE